MSNTRLFIYVIIALFLVVIFGRDPMDDVRKKRAERAGRKLVERIKDSNQKKGGTPPAINPSYARPNRPPPPAGRFNNGGNNAGAINSNQDPYVQQMRQSRSNPDNPIPNMANPNLANPNAVNPRPGNVPPRPNVPAKDEYYPPTPKNPNVKIPLSSVQTPSSVLEASKLFKDPNRTTDDGRELAFWGTKVYVYDNDGNIKPMPDGEYKMYGGKWLMVVRDGNQSIGNGDTGFFR